MLKVMLKATGYVLCVIIGVMYLLAVVLPWWVQGLVYGLATLGFGIAFVALFLVEGKR